MDIRELAIKKAYRAVDENAAILFGHTNK